MARNIERKILSFALYFLNINANRRRNSKERGYPMKSRIAAVSVLPAFVLVLFYCQHAAAMNGYGVYVNYHCPWTPALMWGPGERYWPRGPIVKATITNNKVVRRDTLFRDVGQYPAFSPDGKRIAFFRWGIRINLIAGTWTEVAGTRNTQCYLSVMDADGNNLTNLLPVSSPSTNTTPNGEQASKDCEEGCAVLDWPRVDGEDWIYYEKPPKTAEIWRVKATDPSTNQLVCRYNSGTFLRRWDMSLDGRWSDAQSRGNYGFNSGYAFPLVDNDLGKTLKVGVQGCNSTVSCGANFIVHNCCGNHMLAIVDKWDHAQNVLLQYSGRFWSAYDTTSAKGIEPYLGERITVPGYGDADLNRFSVNSEKWVCREIEWCAQGMGRSQGSNSVAVNWKDRQAVKMSNTPQPPSCPGGGEGLPAGYGLNADAGDLWVDFGAGNENKWEDENGVLHLLAPATMTNGPGENAGNAADILRISRTSAAVAFSGVYTFTVSNVQGEAVISRHGRGPAAVSLQGLRPGIYMVRVRAAGRTYCGKFAPAL